MRPFRLVVLAAAVAAPACLWKSSPHRLPLPTGVRIHVVEAGDPKGEAVVFLHGLTDTSRSFAPVIERLSRIRPELRLIAIDQRGHGASSMPSDPACPAMPGLCFSMEDFARDVVATLDALDDRKTRPLRCRELGAQDTAYAKTHGGEAPRVEHGLGTPRLPKIACTSCGECRCRAK